MKYSNLLLVFIKYGLIAVFIIIDIIPKCYSQNKNNSSRSMRWQPRFFKLRLRSSENITEINGDVLASLPRYLDTSCRNQSQSDAYLTAPELIRKKGYPFELHELESDGYILEVHRIPGPPGSKPILVVHGMGQTSRDFLLQCGKKALAYKLADAGYDVWLPNIRGNDYSRKHKTFSRDDAAYWDFTIDDLIKYDGPNWVDYIANNTNSHKVTWVGFSLGTTIAMGMLSTQPEYNEKIDLFISMAIIAYVNNTGPPIRFIANNFGAIFKYLSDRIQGRLFSNRFLRFFRRVIPRICLPESVLNIPLYCNLALGAAAGFNYHQANARFISILASYTPSQWPAKVILQLMQWAKSGRFSYYDFGKEKNVEKYGQEIPPEYDLKNVKVPVVNFWGENDVAASPTDVQHTISELPNVIANIRVPVKRWTHLDFNFARDADVLVYDKIIESIHEYTS